LTVATSFVPSADDATDDQSSLPTLETATQFTPESVLSHSFAKDTPAMSLVPSAEDATHVQNLPAAREVQVTPESTLV